MSRRARFKVATGLAVIVWVANAALIGAAVLAQSPAGYAYRIDVSIAENDTPDYRWVHAPVTPDELVTGDYEVELVRQDGTVPAHFSGAGGLFVLQAPGQDAATYSAFVSPIGTPGDQYHFGDFGFGGPVRLQWNGAEAAANSCFALQLENFRVTSEDSTDLDVAIIQDYSGADHQGGFNAADRTIWIQNGTVTLSTIVDDIREPVDVTWGWCADGTRLIVGDDDTSGAGGATAPVSSNVHLVTGHSTASAAEGVTYAAWGADRVRFRTLTSYTATPSGGTWAGFADMDAFAVVEDPNDDDSYSIRLGGANAWGGFVWPAGSEGVNAPAPEQETQLVLLQEEVGEAAAVEIGTLDLAVDVDLGAGALEVADGFKFPLEVLNDLPAGSGIPPLFLGGILTVGFAGLALMGTAQTTRSIPLAIVAGVLAGALMVYLSPLPEYLILIFGAGGGIAAALLRGVTQ